MTNERYWIFHEWTESQFYLVQGYDSGTYDGLALAYWYLTNDDYYLQFENKSNTDEEEKLSVVKWFL